MNDFYCIEIQFPEIDFSPFIFDTVAEIPVKHHAHLYEKKDGIELRLYYDYNTYFGEVLSRWVSSIDLKKFGSFLNVELVKNERNQDILKIDLSEARLIHLTTSTDYYENSLKYVVIALDSVKIYSSPDKNHPFTGELYLDDSGFKVVKSFYKTLRTSTPFKNNGKFEINRSSHQTTFYKLLKCSFRPDFNLYSQDKQDERIASIIKEPRIFFKLRKNVSEDEALYYAELVRMVVSFYHHQKIDFIVFKIYLKDFKLRIVKFNEKKQPVDFNGGLIAFGFGHGLHEFLEKNWQADTISNYNLLSKAIELFNQSFHVDSYSSFLIRFNIMEVCNKQSIDNDKFTLILDKEVAQEKRDEALAIMLEMIHPNEHEIFKKRWKDIQQNLMEKPMKNQTIIFLESQNLDPNSFAITMSQLFRLRNNIIHGSIDKVNDEQLRKANILMYRVCGILILNLMGITDWKFDTTIF